MDRGRDFQGGGGGVGGALRVGKLLLRTGDLVRGRWSGSGTVRTDGGGTPTFVEVEDCVIDDANVGLPLRRRGELSVSKDSERCLWLLPSPSDVSAGRLDVDLKEAGGLGTRIG